MPRRRLPLRKINEVLRLTTQGMSRRQVSQSVGLARSTVSDYVERARLAGLSWPLPEGLDGDLLEAKLFPAPVVPGSVSRPMPEWREVHRELKRGGTSPCSCCGFYADLGIKATMPTPLLCRLRPPSELGTAC